ncbi:MAG: hypothetical protein JNM43_28220 [Planctomycetaceae bacterium]|nr:hypothetical protein [Planctomycetaceae bacterium]
MAFFGLFRSREERDAELRTRVRQGTMRIQKFVNQLRRQAETYASLARRAFDLDDQEQFRQLAAGYLQSLETINRWERYMVKLKALELRRHETEATREFLTSMNALTSSILNGVRPEDVAALNMDMEAATQRSEELSEALADAMDESITHVDRTSSLQPEFLVQSVDGAEKRLESLSRTGTSDTSHEKDFWQAIERQKRGEKLDRV